MNQPNAVQEHYTTDDLPSRIKTALSRVGAAEGPIVWSDLARLDQFHTRGLLATKELAEGLGLIGGEAVLDVGCGLGGPARYLAAVLGCHVTGIDLSQPFIEVAAMLGERTGLSDHLTFVQGDATALPFPPESFDHAWTQHVAMNIQDKKGFYRSIHRVLKKGGRLAIFDVVKGENAPVIYPVPWARQASISFLATPSEMVQGLRAAGFSEVSSADTTQPALEWFDAMQSAPEPEGVAALSLGVVMGQDTGQILKNLAQNIKEGRVRLMQTIVQKN